MAYGAMLSLSQTLDNILLSGDEFRVLDAQINFLQQKLSLFISFLEETSQRNSETIEGLEERIRDAVYEAEDIIEPYMLKRILTKSEIEEIIYEDVLHNIMETYVSIFEEGDKIRALKIKNPFTGPVESTSEIEEGVKMQIRNPLIGPVKLESTSETVLDQRPQVRSFPQKLKFLISFLEETSVTKSDSTQELEETIRRMLYAAKNGFKYHMLKKKLSNFKSGVVSCFLDCARCLLSMSKNSEENDEEYSEKKNDEEYLQKKKLYEKGLQNIRAKFESIVGEVEKIKALQIKNTLTGPVKLESTSEIEALKNVMEKLDSIWGEVEKMKDKNNNIEALKIKDPPIGHAAPVEVESISEIVAVEKMKDNNNIEVLRIKDPPIGPAPPAEVESISEIVAVEKMKDNNNNNIEALRIRDPLIGPAPPVEVESASEIVEVEKVQSTIVSLSKYASTNTSEPVVSFEDNILRIKELLVGSSSQLETICIVGMGGIGKTTLARSIYDQPYVSRHFDIRAWITVSQKYDVVALLRDLLKSMGNHTNEMNGENMEKLKRKVYQTLKQRRYLIIMDNVWDTDFLKEFKNILPDDNARSRIVMTSRSSHVANFEHYSGHIHRMNFLNPEQSWNLLRQKALGKESCPLGVEDVGRKIAGKCRGLPLALAIIDGLLFKGKTKREHWEYIEKNMKSIEAGNYDDLIEVLSWSYKNLPHHLRACFLYMAIYPEGYVINVSRLMKLWLAERFIKPIPPKNLEQAAKECLEELIDRNLIIVRDRTYYGEIKTCTIHDLLRELCIRKAREEMFLHFVDKDKYDKETIKNQRFLSLYQWYWFKSAQMRVPTVRSHIYYGHGCPLEKYVLSPLLRVLDASSTILDKFPIGITKLVNLRYLVLLYNGLEGGEVLGSISKLCNLQTLIIKRSFRYHWNYPLYLPAEMTNMQWLRHLQVDGSKFKSFDSGVPNWKLQVLCGLTDFPLTMDVIEKIRDIKTLGIVYVIVDKIELSEYHLENLAHLHQLEKLNLELMDMNMSEKNWYHLPPNLCFPQILNKLTLRGCICSWKELSMIGSIPNLQVLKLKDVRFENNVCKTNEGEFTELKFLLIDSPDWGDWEAEETNFPSLECLSLRRCWKLKCIPPGIGEIPTLRDIVLYQCSSGVVDSANKILNEQHDFGNESLQLHEGSIFAISKSYFR